MEQKIIFAPALVIVGLYLVTLITLIIRRVPAIKALNIPTEALKTSDYRKQLPGNTDTPAQHFTNLTELPPLFLILVISLYVTQTVDSTVMWLAWTFAFFRSVHTFVHLTYNHPRHRGLPFMLASLTLWTMWIKFGIDLFA